MEINNVLRPCKCGCETPVIEESISLGGTYRVICPKCGNGDDMYFIDSIPSCIEAWNKCFWNGSL